MATSKRTVISGRFWLLRTGETVNQNRMIGGTSVIDVIDMIKNQCKKKQGGYMLLSQNRQLIPVKLLHPLKRKGPLLPDSTAAEKHAVRKAAAKSSTTDLLTNLRSLRKCEFYWGSLSAGEAEKRLNGRPNGAFLLRDSTDDWHYFALSFRSLGRTHHARISFSHATGGFGLGHLDLPHHQLVVEFIQLLKSRSEEGNERFLLKSASGSETPVPIILRYPVLHDGTVKHFRHYPRPSLITSVGSPTPAQKSPLAITNLPKADPAVTKACSGTNILPIIPSLRQLRDCTYYWAQLDRRRAEEKLADQPEGTFLLRDSSDECHFFALSFRIPNQTLHVLMSYNQGGGGFGLDTLPNNTRRPSVLNFIHDIMMQCRGKEMHLMFKPHSRGELMPLKLIYPLTRNFFVHSLRFLCRSEIKRNIRPEDIDRLPLSKGLQDYVREAKYYGIYA